MRSIFFLAALALAVLAVETPAAAHGYADDVTAGKKSIDQTKNLPDGDDPNSHHCHLQVVSHCSNAGLSSTGHIAVTNEYAPVHYASVGIRERRLIDGNAPPIPPPILNLV